MLVEVSANLSLDFFSISPFAIPKTGERKMEGRKKKFLVRRAKENFFVNVNGFERDVNLYKYIQFIKGVIFKSLSPDSLSISPALSAFQKFHFSLRLDAVLFMYSK